MSTISPLAPLKLNAIKHAAKRLKRSNHISYTDALNSVSVDCGFSNYIHAQRHYAQIALPPAVSPPQHRQVYLTCYWADHKARTDGSERLTVTLNHDVGSLLKRHELRKVRQLMHFDLVASDHLQTAMVMRDQSMSRELLMAAKRVLQFIDATGLRPVAKGGLKATARGLENGWELPSHDHSSSWVDAQGRRLMVDEPYGPAIKGNREVERIQWAQKNGFTLCRSPWAGMYSPPDSVMDLMTHADHSDFLDTIILALSALPTPAEEWLGKSAPYRPMFISPAANAKKPRNPVDVRTKSRVKRDGTIATGLHYRSTSYRPGTRMSLSEHAKLGKLLSEARTQCLARAGAANRLWDVMNAMDDWVQAEYPSEEELPSEVFFKLYLGTENRGHFGALNTEQLASTLALIEQARTILKAGYPDCAPVKGLLRKLSMAEKSLKSWKPIA